MRAPQVTDENLPTKARQNLLDDSNPPSERLHWVLMGLSLRCRPLAVLSRVSRNLWWNLRTTVAARRGRKKRYP